MGGDAVRVIDKMPGNVFHLGLIALLFPRARVVLCRRDGRDTCLSCFFQHFGRKSSHLFKYDLADCGRQFVETERLMSHWRRVLPLDMLEVQYEQVVANLERESRRLLEFLGLPWDPACLDFHRGHRIVVTASAVPGASAGLHSLSRSLAKLPATPRTASGGAANAGVNREVPSARMTTPLNHPPSSTHCVACWTSSVALARSSFILIFSRKRSTVFGLTCILSAI